MARVILIAIAAAVFWGTLLPLVILNEQLELESAPQTASDVNIVVLQANERPFGLGRVAVVHARSDLGQLELSDLAELVPGEGLGGEEVEGCALLVGKCGPGEGQVVDEGLSGGRSRGHHHVVASVQEVKGPPLVRVQPSDPGAREPPPKDLREIGKGKGLRLRGPEHLDVGQTGLGSFLFQETGQEPASVHTTDGSARHYGDGAPRERVSWTGLSSSSP